MLQPIYKKRFAKDLKRMKRRKKDLSKLKFVVSKLIQNKNLDTKHSDHSLKGEYADCRECHIEPDWLLIYMIKNPEIIFLRTGSHSDLFK